LLIAGLASCACIFNPATVCATFIVDENSLLAGDLQRCWLQRCKGAKVLAGCTWCCVTICFVGSFAVGIYLVAHKLTGFQAAFLADRSYGFDVGVFLFGIPCLICLFGPVGLVMSMCCDVECVCFSDD
jgi:hypothetical protein